MNNFSKETWENNFIFYKKIKKFRIIKINNKKKKKTENFSLVYF